MAGLAIITEARIDMKDRACVDICPVGAVYSEEHPPDGSPTTAKYNSTDSNKGHDQTFFVQHSRDVLADQGTNGSDRQGHPGGFQ